MSKHRTSFQTSRKNGQQIFLFCQKVSHNNGQQKHFILSKKSLKNKTSTKFSNMSQTKTFFFLLLFCQKVIITVKKLFILSKKVIKNAPPNKNDKNKRKEKHVFKQVVKKRSTNLFSLSKSHIGLKIML